MASESVDTENKLAEDLASLSRVRNRLAQTKNDDRLPKILSALLPKVLLRLENYTLESFDIFTRSSNAIDQICGILSHALDRIRSNKSISTIEITTAVIPFINSRSSMVSTWSLSFLSTHIQRESCEECRRPVSAMAALIRCVDALYCEAIQQTPTVFPNRYFNASWLLLDTFMLSFKSPAMTDFETDYFDNESKWRLQKIAFCEATVEDDAILATNENGNGVFHLLIDLILVPLSSPSLLRSQTGISNFGLMRMTYRCGNAAPRPRTGWEMIENNRWKPRWTESAEFYLRHLKVAALCSAIWPVNKGLYQNIGRDKALVLGVLAASSNSMHGRIGEDFLKKSPKECSWTVTCSLLILIVGDRNALPILDDFLSKNENSSILWECILGRIARDEFLQRPPLPLNISERVASFLMNHKLPQRSSNDYNTKHYAKLMVDLCLALVDDPISNPNPNPASADEPNFQKFWCIKLVKSFYKQFLSLSIIDARSPDKWTAILYQRCLIISVEVLTVVVDVGVSNVNRLRTTENTRPLGVPSPFGQRKDLNMLLNSHRESQKRRKLSLDDALEARRASYEFISDLVCFPFEFVSQLLSDHFRTFQLPIVLFSCSLYEEEALQSCVATALDSLLMVYTRAIEKKKWKEMSGDGHPLKQEAVPLLPSLLDAICAHSEHARTSALKWIKSLIYEADPEASYFLSSYIDHGESSGNIELLQQKRALNAYTKFVNIHEEGGSDLIKKEIDLRANELVREFGLSEDVALAILIEFDFSLKASQLDLRKNLEAVLDSLGLLSYKSLETTATCEICYEEMEENNAFSIQCGHCFCQDCWLSLLKDASDQDCSRFSKVKCPQHDCRSRLLSNDIKELDRQQHLKWKDAFIELFVRSDPLYGFCPGPDCNFVCISSNENCIPHSSSCEHCCTKFCFECGAEPHQPASCNQKKEWHRLLNNSSLWIKQNSKPCPGCQAPIEKNLGCNHMTCGICNTEFCWLCLKRLRFHSEAHTCNRYEPGEEDDDEVGGRAVFLVNRYQAHADAEVFALKQYEAFPENPTTWFITEDNYAVLHQAVSFLIEARQFLRNTYVMSFALRRQTILLVEHECHQGALETLIERLSQLTELNLQRLYQENGEQYVMNHFKKISFYQLAIAKYMERILDFGSSTDIN